MYPDNPLIPHTNVPTIYLFIPPTISVFFPSTYFFVFTQPFHLIHYPPVNPSNLNYPVHTSQPPFCLFIHYSTYASHLLIPSTQPWCHLFIHLLAHLSHSFPKPFIFPSHPSAHSSIQPSIYLLTMHSLMLSIPIISCLVGTTSHM